MTTPQQRTAHRRQWDEAWANGISEKAWQAQVLQIAHLHGWFSYHPYDSRRSNPGFPDLTLVRDTRLVFAELKTQKGRIRPEQRDWHDRLARTGVETYLWRPSDLRRVVECLSRPR